GPAAELGRRRERLGSRRGVHGRDAVGHRAEISRREREVVRVAAVCGDADLPAQTAAEWLVRQAAEIAVVTEEVEVAHHPLPGRERADGRADLHDGTDGLVAWDAGKVFRPPAVVAVRVV